MSHARTHNLCFGGFFGTAEKLSVSPETIQHGVEGLMYLLTECAKLMVSFEECVYGQLSWKCCSFFLPK